VKQFRRCVLSAQGPLAACAIALLGAGGARAAGDHITEVDAPAGQPSRHLSSSRLANGLESEASDGSHPLSGHELSTSLVLPVLPSKDWTNQNAGAASGTSPNAVQAANGDGR
jgi:hypothetical protein